MACRISKEIDSSHTFKESRELIDQTIGEIVQSLNEKRDELFSQIDVFEDELKGERDEVISDIERLENLMQQTEGLAKNSLSDLQEKLNGDISVKIDKLKNDMKKRPSLELNCDKSRIIEAIGSIYVERYESYYSDESGDSEVSSQESGKECDGGTEGDLPKDSKGKNTKREKKEFRKKEKKEKREERKEKRKERKEKRKHKKEKSIEGVSDKLVGDDVKRETEEPGAKSDQKQDCI